MEGKIIIRVEPRVSKTWEEFVAGSPERSIALDGYVQGGPRIDLERLRFNFDHHSGVVRAVTMSTCMQVHHAIKGGIMDTLGIKQGHNVYLYINDPDQDTALAVWQFQNYAELEGVKSPPGFNRLLALTDRWDITAGAFPMNLRERLVQEHNWVFEPYSELRKSGALASANEAVMRSNLDATLSRITKHFIGESEQKELDTRYEILHNASPYYLVTNEIGGNEARYWLYAHTQMNSFVARVASRPDGRTVYSIGKRSPYIDFPLPELYSALNRAEGLSDTEGWNGSDMIGGSSRQKGSGLLVPQIVEVLNQVLRESGIMPLPAAVVALAATA